MHIPQQLQSVKALIRSVQISIMTPNINCMQLKQRAVSHSVPTCLMTSGMDLHIQWTEFTRPVGSVHCYYMYQNGCTFNRFEHNSYYMR